MSAKTENDDATTAAAQQQQEQQLEDQDYDDIKGFVSTQFAPYLQGEPAKTVLEFRCVPPDLEDDRDDDDDDVRRRPFVRRKLAPTAAIERVRREAERFPSSEFGEGFTHAVAFSYEQEILQAYAKSPTEPLPCRMCKTNPATKLFMVPTTAAIHDEPPQVLAALCEPMCDNRACRLATRDKVMTTLDKFRVAHREVTEELGVPVCSICGRLGPEKMKKCTRCQAAYYCSPDCCSQECQREHWETEHRSAADPRTCSSCGKSSAEKLKKCTQCQAAYYCDQDCQRKHWKAGHRKRCRAPSPPLPPLVD